MVNSQSDTTKLIMGFVGLIIAIVILASASDSIFQQTNTFNTVNASVTVGAVNSTTGITGRNLIAPITYTIYNATNATPFILGTETNTSFFTIADSIIGGAETVSILVDQNSSGLVGEDINVSYEYADAGFINDSGGRNITNLIPIMAAVAILVFSLMMLFSTNAGRNLLGRK